MSKFKKTFAFVILATLLFVFLLCMIAKPTSIRIGESYANKIVEPKESFPIYNNETSYQPGDVRTLPFIHSK